MSAADCRAARCGCYYTDGALTVRQWTQTGWRQPDGTIMWEEQPFSSWVPQIWADHVRNRCTDPALVIGWVDGWLVYRIRFREREVGRIRWETAELAYDEVAS